MRPAGFEPATKGFKHSDGFPPAWTISPSDQRIDFSNQPSHQRPGAVLSVFQQLEAGVIVESHPASL